MRATPPIVWRVALPESNRGESRDAAARTGVASALARNVANAVSESAYSYAPTFPALTLATDARASTLCRGVCATLEPAGPSTPGRVSADPIMRSERLQLAHHRSLGNERPSRLRRFKARRLDRLDLRSWQLALERAYVGILDRPRENARNLYANITRIELSNNYSSSSPNEYREDIPSPVEPRFLNVLLTTVSKTRVDPKMDPYL